MPIFLQQQLKPKEGDVIEIPASLPALVAYHQIEPTIENVERLSAPFIFSKDQGIPVAKHQGAHYYTIGQRKGLHIGGRPLPSFVIQIDTQENCVFSGQSDDHPALNKWALFIQNSEIHSVNPNHDLQVGEIRDFRVRIRYRQALQTATLIRKENGIYMLFHKLQRGITPGQFAAWYAGDELVGSGVIH